MANKPTKSEYEGFKKAVANPMTPPPIKQKLQSIIDQYASEYEGKDEEPKEKTITMGERVNKKGKVEPFKQENGKDVKPKATRGRKPASPRATKKTTTDIEQAKAEIKAKTGKTEEECEAIIEQYRALRIKAQEGKRKAEQASATNKKRVEKLDQKGDLIEGTNVKTADAVIESTAKDVAEKIEQQIEAVEDKAEKEAKAEVAKDKSIKTPKAKKEAVEAKVEKKVKEKTKVVVQRVVIDTSALLTSIATTLGKFDKDSQKEFLIKLRSDIDKLLAKYAFGGMTDGATQVMNIQQSNLSASSVNPTLFANGGIVQEDAQSINTIALLNGVRKSENTFQEFKRKLTQIIKRNGYRMPTAKAFEIAYETNQFAHGGGVDKLPANLKKRLDKANSIIVKYNGKPITEAQAIRFNADQMPQSGFDGGLKAFKLSNAKGFENAPKRDYETIGDALVDISRKMSNKDIYANGGVIGQEIVFDDNGEENTGVIDEITNLGDYIVRADDGRRVLASRELDVISLGAMRQQGMEQRKKRFGFFKKGGILGSSAQLEYIDEAYASSELEDELRERLGLKENTNSLGDNVVISFAYTDYGGDFLDKVAIEYFKENYPDNTLSENTSYSGENAFVFGEPAQEWIDSTEDYPLGFEDFEDFYFEKMNEAEYESFEYFLSDLERDYTFDTEEVMSWLMENKGGYYRMTTQGLDFSYSDLTDELIQEGLISKEDEDDEEYAKGGGIKDVIVYDNQGETFDRYTIFTPDGSVYGMSDNALMPNGFNMYIGDNTEIEKGSHLGKRLKSVPESIKVAVERRMSEEYAKGGLTEHGLKVGDRIVKKVDKKGEIIKVSTMDGKNAFVGLNTGFRTTMKKGGNVSSMLRNRRGM